MKINRKSENADKRELQWEQDYLTALLIMYVMSEDNLYQRFAQPTMIKVCDWKKLLLDLNKVVLQSTILVTQCIVSNVFTDIVRNIYYAWIQKQKYGLYKYFFVLA